MLPLVRITPPVIAQAQPTMIREIQLRGIDISAQIVEGRRKQVLDDGHQHVRDIRADEHFLLETRAVGLADAGLVVGFLDLAFDVGEDLFELLDFERAALDDVFEGLEGRQIVGAGAVLLRVGLLEGAVRGAAEAAEAAAVVFEEGAGGRDHDEGEGGGVEGVDLRGVSLQSKDGDRGRRLCLFAPRSPCCPIGS